MKRFTEESTGDVIFKFTEAEIVDVLVDHVQRMECSAIDTDSFVVRAEALVDGETTPRARLTGLALRVHPT